MLGARSQGSAFISHCQHRTQDLSVASVSHFLELGDPFWGIPSWLCLITSGSERLSLSFHGPGAPYPGPPLSLSAGMGFPSFLRSLHWSTEGWGQHHWVHYNEIRSWNFKQTSLCGARPQPGAVAEKLSQRLIFSFPLLHYQDLDIQVSAPLII